MDEWLKDIHQAAFFTPDRGVVETCKYWTPSQDPSTDTPAESEVTAIVKRSTQEASYGDNTGSTDRSGSAMLQKPLDLTRCEPGDYGVLEDAENQRWRITGKNGETAAYHWVELTTETVAHFGGVRASE